MQYPPIGNITINENTTAAQFVVYLFSLAISIGAFVAVIMMIMAGIEWITSTGNPSKIESAKGKIANTLFGVAVLIGCYIVLNTINSQLTTVKIDDLYCDHGIVIKVTTPDGKEKQKCVDSNVSDIEKEYGGPISSTIAWKFPKDYLLKVYTYSEINFKGTITQIDCNDGSCSGNIAGAKSIYFVLNIPGIYLYDSTNYQPGAKGYPFFTSTSISDLATTSTQFENSTESLEIVNYPEKDNIYYFAVVFTDPTYTGRCAFIGENVPNMGSHSDNYTDTIGNNTLSSLIVVRTNYDESVVNKERGKVILYSKTNCSESGLKKEEIKSCTIEVDSGTPQSLQNIKDLEGEDCKKWDFASGADRVQSFEITGDIGIVLSTSEKDKGNENTYCQYYDKKDLEGGTCHSSIIDEPHIYSVGGGISPKSIIILPKN